MTIKYKEDIGYYTDNSEKLANSQKRCASITLAHKLGRSTAMTDDQLSILSDDGPAVGDGAVLSFQPPKDLLGHPDARVESRGAIVDRILMKFCRGCSRLLSGCKCESAMPAECWGFRRDIRRINEDFLNAVDYEHPAVLHPRGDGSMVEHPLMKARRADRAEIRKIAGIPADADYAPGKVGRLEKDDVIGEVPPKKGRFTLADYSILGFDMDDLLEDGDGTGRVKNEFAPVQDRLLRYLDYNRPLMSFSYPQVIFDKVLQLWTAMGKSLDLAPIENEESPRGGCSVTITMTRPSDVSMLDEYPSAVKALAKLNEKYTPEHFERYATTLVFYDVKLALQLLFIYDFNLGGKPWRGEPWEAPFRKKIEDSKLKKPEVPDVDDDE